MKSLKRTLSLVLALVMVLGLFGGLTMTASASKFTDDDDVQYNEAVDVMTAIGAINGMGDGTFKPKNTITRAEAAKLVAYTVLGAETAKRLTGVSTKFTDVPADKYDWAIPSIEYLVKAGAINGVGGGKFEPNEDITGYEILKMLLCCLGYGKKGEYKGDGWDLQVAIDANSNKLAKSLADGVKSGNAATREEVALYCLNTIQTKTVEYSDILGYFARGDILMTTVYPTLGKDTTKLDDPIGNATLSDGSELDAKSAMGEPATVWALDGKVIGEYADAATKTYTTTVSPAKMATELKGLNLPSNDGAADTNFNPQVNGTKGANIAKAASGVTATQTNAIAGLTGNGYTVKIYVEDKNITSIVVIKSDLAEVGAVATDGSITLTSKNTGALNATYKIEKNSDFYGLVSGLTKGDLVVVTPVDTEPSKITKVNMMTGTVTKLDSTTGKYTINGAEYAVAAYKTGSNPAVDANNQANIWLDSNNLIVKYAPVESAAASTFCYAIDFYQTLVENKITDMATLVLVNGDKVDVPYYNGTAGASGAELKDADIGLFEFNANDATKPGKYVLTKIDPDTSSGNYITDGAITSPTNGAAGKATQVLPSKQFKSTESILNKTLTGDGTGYWSNYYSTDVMFHIINKTAKTVESLKGVQDVKTHATEVSYVVIGQDAATKKDVVIAAFIVNGSVGSADPNTIIFSGNNTTYNTKTGIEGNKTDFLYTYKLWLNGEETDVVTYNNAGPLTANTIYQRTPNAKSEGSYDLTKVNASANTATADTEALGVLMAAKITSVYGSSMTTDYTYVGTGNDDPVLTFTADTKVVDTRSTADKTSAPLTVNSMDDLAGILAGEYKELEATIITDGKNNALYVYITGTGAAAVDVTIPSNPTGTGASTWTLAFDNTKTYFVGDTVTVTVSTATLAATGKDTITFTHGASDTAINPASVDPTGKGYAIATNTLVITSSTATTQSTKSVNITFTVPSVADGKLDMKAAVTTASE